MTPGPAPAVRILEEWVLRGGYWQVLTSSPEHTSVSLLTCDGGEEMERVVDDGPELHDWLAGRTSSAD
ncbi:hypothetical protein I601_0376 [Nocardioides dokdonensis FR1436]|uniref:Uncharacterized protein n=1 Tax=Nocardioides dokdonensis FR1436 TaxID=1300347 RepID=A0A1A9GEY2_9ACTN|nr:hypothetical protein [Nocardioides dokdonensis]ANH36828.1 hypothetical protein I601_0376 [Nocardioides dokdonensis FR1436]